MSDERWVGAHRSLDGTELHPGFKVERRMTCDECGEQETTK